MPKTYYKLARWDLRTQCFKDGKRPFASHREAIKSVNTKPGRYRLSTVNGKTRVDHPPFDVGGPDGPVIQPPANPQPSTATPVTPATRPMAGRPH